MHKMVIKINLFLFLISSNLFGTDDPVLNKISGTESFKENKLIKYFIKADLNGDSIDDIFAIYSKNNDQFPDAVYAYYKKEGNLYILKDKLNTGYPVGFYEPFKDSFVGFLKNHSLEGNDIIAYDCDNTKGKEILAPVSSASYIACKFFKIVNEKITDLGEVPIFQDVVVFEKDQFYIIGGGFEIVYDEAQEINGEYSHKQYYQIIKNKLVGPKELNKDLVSFYYSKEQEKYKSKKDYSSLISLFWFTYYYNREMLNDGWFQTVLRTMDKDKSGKYDITKLIEAFKHRLSISDDSDYIDYLINNKIRSYFIMD